MGLFISSGISILNSSWDWASGFEPHDSLHRLADNDDDGDDNMDDDDGATEFEKADEIYFRLGIIYKQQQKYQQSLDVSDPRYLFTNPWGVTHWSADVGTFVFILIAIVLPTHIAKPAEPACEH
jgi:hypothetical protein